ncbi:MAG: hypothetical protein GQF41_4268 [Candidatus Rifleibacterium amylolyticum]|nr:MAG: hypothetical protein GQF41_4268 [Candidatus Rifleibacterium amylolyticum]
MKEVLSMFAGLYTVSLCGFLLFIKKGFLQITGESSLPSIDMCSHYEGEDTEELAEDE